MTIQRSFLAFINAFGRVFKPIWRWIHSDVKKFIFILSGLIGSLFLVVFALLLLPGPRYLLLRVATELPGVATQFGVRQAMPYRRFDEAVAYLDRHLSLAQRLGVHRSKLLPSLVANTEFTVERARLRSEHAATVDYLDRLVKTHPDLYLARIWLSRALVSSDPEATFAHLERAARLVPADERAYRIAIEAALALNRPETARSWCERYRLAQFGGPHPNGYKNIFMGTGLRKLALQVPDGNGGTTFVTNEGLSLGQRRSYDFLLPNRMRATELQLHLGILPGIKVRVHGVSLFGPEHERHLTDDELVVTSLRGYNLDPATVMTASSDGEVLIFRSRDGGFGPLDRVDFELTFERLSLTNLPGCGADSVG